MLKINLIAWNIRLKSTLELNMKNKKSKLLKKNQKRKSIQKRMSTASGMKRALKWKLLDSQDSSKIGENGTKLTQWEILALMRLLSSMDLEARLEKETTTLHYQASSTSKIDWNGMHGTTTDENQENKQQLNSSISPDLF